MFCNKFHAVTKWSQMHTNTTKCTETLVLGPMGWVAPFVAKKADVTSWHELLHYLLQFTPFCTEFQAVTKRSQMHPNPTKCTETLVLGPMGWIGSIRCEKNPTWLRGTNFCINCTCSPRFAPSFLQLRNDPKCTQTLWNTPKHDFWVKWGGSGAFAAKNYNVTSWHKLFY